MNIVYFGSSEFASGLLKRMVSVEIVPSLIVTTPDTCRGRGLKNQPSPVKALAQKSGYACIDPEDLTSSSCLKQIEECRADVFIIASYGKRIPKNILEIPKEFPLGVHPSLLPDLRGAAPIQRALLRGDAVTGVTVFVVKEKIDSGPILVQKELDIHAQDDYCSLSERLVSLSAQVLAETLSLIREGNYTLAEQDETAVTYAAKLKKTDGKIRWDRPASEIVNLIRATKGWPSAFTSFGGKQVKVLKAGVAEGEASGVPGTIANIDAGGICVVTKDKPLKIYSVCPQGKKEMPASSFVNGYRVKVGDRFE